jgi:hypothetical protein
VPMRESMVDIVGLYEYEREQYVLWDSSESGRLEARSLVTGEDVPPGLLIGAGTRLAPLPDDFKPPPQVR